MMMVIPQVLGAVGAMPVAVRIMPVAGGTVPVGGSQGTIWLGIPRGLFGLGSQGDYLAWGPKGTIWLGLPGDYSIPKIFADFKMLIRRD